MGKKDYRGHVLAIPYPSQGHINPLLQFAKLLAAKGLKATLATTHYTLKSISATGVNVEPFSDGFDEHGYAQAPSTEAYLDGLKVTGSRTLGELIQKFNGLSSPVNCIIYDSFLTWALDVAREYGIYGAAFFTNSATVCCIYSHVTDGLLPLPVAPEATPVSLPNLPPLGFSDLPSPIKSTTPYSAYLKMLMNQFSNLEMANWVFENSFDQLEHEVVKPMSKRWKMKMVGPLVPSAYLDGQIKGDKWYGANLWKPINDECMKWLGERPAESVVYVSFGSMPELNAKKMEEIAFGLKESGSSFLWVVKESDQYMLPDGFMDSIKGKGLVVTWCHQLEVLAHEAVGCFVSHNGWNSTLEGLSLGVPIVGLPLWADQGTNAKFVEEAWGIGLKAKVNDKGFVSKEELKLCIREVMEGNRRQEIKRNASKWRKLAKEAVGEGGSSDKNINEFVEQLIKDEGITMIYSAIL